MGVNQNSEASSTDRDHIPEVSTACGAVASRWSGRFVELPWSSRTIASKPRVATASRSDPGLFCITPLAWASAETRDHRRGLGLCNLVNLATLRMQECEVQLTDPHGTMSPPLLIHSFIEPTWCRESAASRTHSTATSSSGVVSQSQSKPDRASGTFHRGTSTRFSIRK
jgi:hypothetical protein